MANGGNTTYRLSDMPANVENKFVDSGGIDWIIADAHMFGGIDLSYNEPSGAATNAHCSGIVENTTRQMSITGAIENARGSNSIDRIVGNTLANILYGDLQATGPGDNDFVIGLDGNDTIYGGAGDDDLYGGAGKDRIEGGAGKDRIEGGAGDDDIHAAQGNDTLTGDAGKDVFYFEFSPKNNVDRLTDFDVGSDRMHLDRGVFHALGSGTLPAKQFVANKSGHAETSDQHIIYETDTGKLYYDSDGKGGHDAVEFAVLDKHLGLTHSDFYS